MKKHKHGSYTTVNAKQYVDEAVAELAHLLNVTRAYNGSEPIGITLAELDEVEKYYHLPIAFKMDPNQYLESVRYIMSALVYVLRDGLRHPERYKVPNH